MTQETFEDPFQIFVHEAGNLGLENASGIRRYYSIYLGQVVANDSGQQGMVKVIVRATGQTKALPLLARPSSPFAGPDHGLYTPPEPGSFGWVMFDHGDKTARPRFIGGFWRNPKKDGKSENSEVPEEFKTEDGKPEIRGFKSPGGSGWRVSDQEATPFLELWTGEQAGEGVAAIQHHTLKLDDMPGLERVSMRTFLGHIFDMVDNPAGERGILLQSLLGSQLFFDDSEQRLSMSTPSGHSITLDEINLKLTILSLGEIDITAQKQLNVFSGGPAAFEMATTFDMNVIGPATWTFLAALTMTVTGVVTIITPAGLGLVIALGIVTIGIVGAAAFRFIIEPFITLYNANIALHNSNVASFNSHIHPFIGNLGTPGVTAPTLTPQVPVVAVDPNAVTAQNLRGN